MVTTESTCTLAHALDNDGGQKLPNRVDILIELATLLNSIDELIVGRC